jgi:hypothetical protein
MDGNRFDQIATSLAAARTRRGLLELLAALAAIFPLLAVDESEAGKGAGGRKGGRQHGRNRTRRRHARRRKHKKNKKKVQPQEQCSLELPDGPCAGDQLCVEGACQPCTVTCDGDPGVCGAALQAAIDAAPSEPIIVCPGRYAGGFIIGAGVRLIGAGDGEDPSSNTIFDAQGVGRVLITTAEGAGDIVLEHLRLTGGGGNNGLGGGIVNGITRTLAMTRCTVSGNHTTNPGSGGGIFNAGMMTLSDCRIEDNRANHGGGITDAANGFTRLTGNTLVRGNTAVIQGGGIFVFPGGDVTIGADCRVTENAAPAGQGGGIYAESPTITEVTLESAQSVTNNSGGNCAGMSIDNCVG